MKRLAIALTLTTVTLGLLATDADAAGGPFQKWRAYGKPDARAAKTHRDGKGVFYRASPFTNYQSVEDAYPRYIGAFHSRYFNDLGIPTGDVGIRGNTVNMLPW